MAHVSLENQLKKLLSDKKKVLSLKFENGTTLEQALRNEAKRFIAILKDEINRAVYSRPEGWYKRTGKLLDSIDENIVIDPKTNTIVVRFLDDKAWHDSAITARDSSYKRPAYVPAAIIQGFHALDTSGERWHKSSHFHDGVDFIENAINRFNNEKMINVSIRVEGKEGLMGNWWK